MFRKPEDDLFARIFDEGGSGDSRMEWVRDGLKDLREVPSHGLSNERLRDRILGSAVTPARSSHVPWWAWAWAPVAAAAVAVVILPGLTKSVEPRLVSGSGLEQITDKPRPIGIPSDVIASTDEPRVSVRSSNQISRLDVEEALVSAMEFTQPEPTLVKSGGAEAVPSERSSVVRRRTVRPRSTRSKPLSQQYDASAYVAFNDEPREEKPEAMTMALNSPATREAAPAADSTALRPAPADPLVVLAPEINAQTGAASAFEVSSPANLSVGG